MTFFRMKFTLIIWEIFTKKESLNVIRSRYFWPFNGSIDVSQWEKNIVKVQRTNKRQAITIYLLFKHEEIACEIKTLNCWCKFVLGWQAFNLYVPLVRSLIESLMWCFYDVMDVTFFYWSKQALEMQEKRLLIFFLHKTVAFWKLFSRDEKFYIHHI